MNHKWSFSRLKSFEQCPKQFYHEKVLKLYPQIETEAMRYGTAVHLAAEEYVRDNKPLPDPYKYVKPVLDNLTNIEGDKLCELGMGLTADLEPCEADAENAWFRGYADLVILNKGKKLAWVLDYKTGKSAKYADKGQLELMALAVFKHFPEVDTVRAGLLFVRCDALIKDVYTRSQETELWQKWLTKYARMEKAYESDVWNTNPSGLCKKHCPVTECPHNGNH